MASISQPVSMKQLAQLLEEKQEPFALQIYLSERRYRNKILRSDSNGFEPQNSAMNVNNRSRGRKAKGIEGIPNGSPILRLAINKLISNKYFQKVLYRKNKIQQDKGQQANGKAKKQQNNAMISPSSLRGTNLIHLSSEGDAKICFRCPTRDRKSTFQALKLNNLRKPEAATRTNQWGDKEDSKQLSPVSVLEELPSDEGYQAYNKYSQLLFQMKEKSPHFLKPELFSMQRKQLLFGKVTEEFRKVICEQISSCRKQYGDVKTINQLIHLDFSITTVECRNFQLVNKKIGIEIADAILCDIIMETIEVSGY